MTNHPIEDLMRTSMENLKQMIDVNTIMGKPVSTHDGSVVLTVSKVAFGFGAGGSDFGDGVKKTRTAAGEKPATDVQFAFGGGSGAGVSMSPVAFLVVGAKGVQVMHLHSGTHLIEKAMDAAPQALKSVQSMMSQNQNQSQNQSQNQ